jgi:hypothetical protein
LLDQRQRETGPLDHLVGMSGPGPQRSQHRIVGVRRRR